MQNCIAVLGFATKCSDANQVTAYEVGRQIALGDYTACAGNSTGTFPHVFTGAKSVNGHTLAVLEAGVTVLDETPCDAVIYAPDSDAKHQLIADKCLAAIVIGGGHGTKKLITQFLNLDKPVVAIAGSGGVVIGELDARVKVVDPECFSIKELCL